MDLGQCLGVMTVWGWSSELLSEVVASLCPLARCRVYQGHAFGRTVLLPQLEHVQT